MTTLIHKMVAQCRSGDNPRTVCRVQSGWVVLGEAQFLRGYSLILPDPVVGHLNELDIAARTILLREAALVGDALLEITGAIRINYEILGNLEPALHVHIFPRFADEPEHLKTSPVWFYDWKAAPVFQADRDAALKEGIAAFMKHSGVVLE